MATNSPSNDKKPIDWEAVNAFREKAAPGNEARTIAEYAAILAYWDEREPQTGMPRGILLDDQVIQEIPPMHKIVIGAVYVNTSKSAGQVFALPGGLVGLGAPVYLSIAAAAGISFPEEASIIDPASTPDRITAKVGAIRTDLAGQAQFKTGVYTLDIDNKCAIEASKGSKSEADILRYRQNLRENPTGRAITGAQRGAVKAHYGKLRRKWEEQDFEVPLLVPRLVTDMKAILDTPEGRTMFAMQATGLAKALAFGGVGSVLADMLSAAPPFHAQLAAPIAGEAFEDRDDDDIPGAGVQTQETQKDPPKQEGPSKAQEWRLFFAAAKEAGVPGTNEEIQARARAAVATVGGIPDKSETWTAEQWKAARSILVPPVATPTLSDANMPDSDAFTKLPRPEREAWVAHLVATRQLRKPMVKSPAELPDETLAIYFDGLQALPTKVAA